MAGTSVDLVYFDLGGVLVHRPVDVAAVARELSLVGAQADPARIESALWTEARDVWDGGGSAAEYYRDVAARLGVDAPTADVLSRLLAAERARWLDVEPTALRLLRDLQAAGVRTGILSNAPRDLPVVLGLPAGAPGGPAAGEQGGPGALPAVTWANAGAPMDPAVFSGRVGACKPDPAIFREAISRAGVPAGRIGFLDDKPANVAAARAAGMQAWHWEGPASDGAVRAALGLAGPRV